MTNHQTLADRLYAADVAINAPDQGSCGNLEDYECAVHLLSDDQYKALSAVTDQELRALHSLPHEYLNSESVVVASYLIVINAAMEAY